MTHAARARHARFSAGGRPPPRVRRRRHPRGLRSLRVRAARDAGRREHRDAARQVRRRRQQAHLQDPEARRARGHRPGRPRAALRPDGAAGARRGRVSGEAAEVLQALSDSAGVARRSPGARPLPRVLSVRHRRVGSTSPVVEAELCAAVQRGPDEAGVRRLHDPAESPAAADGAADAGGIAAMRSTATRWSRSTSSTRSARDGVESGARRARGHRSGGAANGAGCLRLGAAGSRPTRSARALDARARRRRRDGRRGPARDPALAGDHAGAPGTCGSTRAWRAACRTTPARSWRSPCRTWPAASAAAAATTI